MKREFVGKVIEREIDYGNDISFYHDISVEDGDYLTEEIYELEGKRVRVTIETLDQIPVSNKLSKG